MGGDWSTRWGLHDKKVLVEHCWTLTVSAFKEPLQRGTGTKGVLEWSVDGRRVRSLRFLVDEIAHRQFLYLSYRLPAPGYDEGIEHRCSVDISKTYPNYGGIRYWFICPLSSRGVACRRRVTKLYLPPGARLFGCRHCHDLTYRSCQEQHSYARIWARLAAEMQDICPGMTGDDVRRQFWAL